MTTQAPSKEWFARSLAAGLISILLLFATMMCGFAGLEHVAGWLSVGMFVTFLAAVWFALGARP